jgi:predicted ATPase
VEPSAIGAALPIVAAIVGVASGSLTLLISLIHGYRHVQRRRQAGSAPATVSTGSEAVTTVPVRPAIEREAEHGAGAHVTRTASASNAKDTLPPAIRTPDQRLRVFVSSTLQELAEERAAARQAITRLRLVPVLFELGARPHPPRSLYRAYLAQSDVFIGIYGAKYGWVAPDEDVSGLEDEYRLSGDKPKLIYLKKNTIEREPRLVALLDRIRAEDHASYKAFSTAAELRGLIANDLALLLTERFILTQGSGIPPGPDGEHAPEPAAGTPTPSPVEPSTGALSTDRTNLPVRRGVLIGRDVDLRALHDLVLNAEGHLVTLTGAGGCGKTSLGLEVARRLAAQFEDGVWLVELAPLADPDLVTQAVASTLGVRDSSDRPLLDGVIGYLRTRAVLLVLDNCEHLVEACAGLAERLLTVCANLHILATSREPLRIPGEVTWRIPSLPFPDLARLPQLDELSETPAVRLFDDRARAAQPQFTLSTQNARAVARVCARLDGMPLALELAAAHVPALAVETLADRLDEGFRLLAGGSRTAPSRQQTLQPTLDWSYRLLEVAEQAALRRLAVFAGGFELDAAEVVCSAERGITSSDVLELLTNLVAKSLVQVTESGGEARYRLLETVRAYALEHLDDAGETAVVRARHAAYYLGVAERVAAAVWGEQLLGPFGQAEQQFVPLERELDNLRAALAWADEREAETFARLGIALWAFWFVEGYIGEGWRWAEACLAQRTDVSPVLRARSLGVAACLALWRGTTPARLGSWRRHCHCFASRAITGTSVWYSPYWAW